MPTLSGGINLALSAVLAQTQAMQIVEHNVANANTPGYRRQAAVMTTANPSGAMPLEHALFAGEMGTGVTVDKIDRFNLQFFDGRYRAVSADAAQWSAQQSVITQLESTLAETSTDGLIPTMDQFWTGWSSLASDPTNMALRAQVLDNASGLADAFRRRSTQMYQIQADQDLAVKDAANQINQMSKQIADLNAEISHVLSVGNQPNDLKDKRDLLLDQLSQLTGAVSSEQANGEVMVSINGHNLVTGHDTFKVAAQQDAANKNLYQVVWATDNSVMTPPAGTLKGIFAARDTIIAGQMTGLDSLAVSMMGEVNKLHITGFDLNGAAGLPMFTGTNAGSMRVNVAVQPANIAAAGAAGEPGNSDIAAALAGLKLVKQTAASTVNLNGTMNDYYNAQVTSLGLILQTAKDNATHQGLVEKALSDQRESVAGVNLDEEAANLMKFQRGYQAATRVMNAYDEMLDKVINGMGLVGR
jgi:flagellar hook-associated protein 1 FlgK